jgi:hypothetical protein
MPCSTPSSAGWSRGRVATSASGSSPPRGSARRRSVCSRSPPRSALNASGPACVTVG